MLSTQLLRQYVSEMKMAYTTILTWLHNMIQQLVEAATIAAIVGLPMALYFATM